MSFIHEDVRRIWNVDLLPTVRCFMVGRGWMKHFGVEQRPLEDVRPPWFDRVREGRRWVLCFTLEADVRELVTTGGWSHERFEELRPGVFAMWSEVG